MSTTHEAERTNLQTRIHSNSVKLKSKMIVAADDEEYNPDHCKPGYAFHVTQVYTSVNTVSCCIIPWHVAAEQNTFALQVHIPSSKKHVVVCPDHHTEIWEEGVDATHSSLVFKQDVGDFRFAAHVWARFWGVGDSPAIAGWVPCARSIYPLAALLARLRSMCDAPNVYQDIYKRMGSLDTGWLR